MTRGDGKRSGSHPEPLRRAPVPVTDARAFRREFPGANPYANGAARNAVRLGDVVVDAVNRRLRKHGLQLSSAQVLAMLEGAEQPLTPNEIGANVHLTSGSITTLLDSLERRGLLRRMPHPGDRRKLLVGITDEGRKLVDEYLPETVAIQTALFAPIPEQDLAALIELAATVLEHSQTIDIDAVADAAKPRKH